ncbi:MAG TPA: hypothetical protein VG433_00205 [Pirellulales bacterium]|jgi:hypothetical protein|nr:hypothetical protein [Pirellulales bacterium]
MPFQFYCPQGHLLEGHESQMGQQSQCPLCGAVFLIPMLPQSAPPAAAVNPLHDLEPAPAPPPPPPPAAAEPPPPAVQEAPPPEPPKVEQPIQPRVFRIACPKGHILETPSDMVGQQALCPYCNTQFELRYEDSVEYQEEQAAVKLRREQEINRLWVKWSIGAVIVVLVMFLGMILYVTVIRPMNEPGG